MQTQACPARLTMSASLPQDNISEKSLFSVLMELFSTKTAQSVTGGKWESVSFSLLTVDAKVPC